MLLVGTVFRLLWEDSALSQTILFFRENYSLYYGKLE